MNKKIEALPVLGSAGLGLLYVLTFTDVRDPVILVVFGLLALRGLLGMLS